MEVALALIVGVLVGAALYVVVGRVARPRTATEAEAERIHRRLDLVGEGVDDLAELVRRSGGEHQAKFGELSATLRSVDERTGVLTNVLGNSRLRGQWGERSAEDILRVAGFTEGVSYHKQKAVNRAGARPDFVFPLPQGLSVNMDAKFPLDNYARSVEAASDAEREECERAFLRDVRERVKEVATRGYIDPDGGTVDYALLFIPSESVYAAINQLDPGFVDRSLSQHVVCCSPLTLFVVLAVIRQAVDSFALQRASDEVVRLMGRFDDEWRKFAEGLAVLGRRLDSAQGAYADLSGPRTRQLERVLGRIDAVRQGRTAPTEQVPTLALFEEGVEDEASR